MYEPAIGFFNTVLGHHSFGFKIVKNYVLYVCQLGKKMSTVLQVKKVFLANISNLKKFPRKKDETKKCNILFRTTVLNDILKQGT